MTISTSPAYKGTNRLILGICLGVATYWLFALSVTALVPTICEALGVSAEALAIPISITALMAGVFIVPFGSISDRFGRLRIARFGLIAVMIGSAIAGAANTVLMLTIGRALQGIAAAMIMPSTLALINAYYKDGERLRALSFWSISSWGGGGLCNIFGGAIATYIGWRWAFWTTIPVAMIALWAMAATPESRIETSTSKRNIDFIGLVLLVVGLLTANLALAKGRAIGWTNPLILGSFALSIVLLYAFTAYEKRCKAPLVDMSLFNRRSYNGAVISNFMLNSTLGSLMVLMTYLQIGRGISPFDAGLLTLGYTATTLIMIRIGERIGKNFGARGPMLIGCSLAAIGIGMQGMTFVTGSLYLVMVAVGLGVMGIGFGVSATPSTNIAVGEAPPEKAGAASGIYKMASSLGGSIGLSIALVVYSAVSASESSTTIHEAAFFGIYTGVAACIIAIISVILLVPKTSSRTLIAPVTSSQEV